MQYTKEIQTGRKVIESEDRAFNGKESELQKQCENLLKQLNITYVRIPDSVYKTGRMKGKAGIPDLIILRESGDRFPNVLLVELKNKYGKMTQAQKNFSRKVTVHLIRNYKTFEKIVVEFIDH